MLNPMVVFNKNTGLFCDNNIPGISHSLHTHTSATSCPTDTSQRSHPRLIPAQDLGWTPKRDAQESPHLDASHPFPSFPPALAGLHLPQRHSRAESPAPTQGLCSAPTRENPNLGAPHLADTLRKVMPDPPDTKAQHKNLPLLPAPPLIPMEASPQNSCCVGPGRCCHFPALELNNVPGHTHNFGNLGLGQDLCIRMAESSEVIS